MGLVNKSSTLIFINIIFIVLIYCYFIFSTGIRFLAGHQLNQFVVYMLLFAFLILFIFDIYCFKQQNKKILWGLFYLFKWLLGLLLMFIASLNILSSSLEYVGKAEAIAVYRQYVIPDSGAKITVYQKEKHFPFLLAPKMTKRMIFIDEDEYFVITKTAPSQFLLETSKNRKRYLLDISTWTITPEH